MAYKKIKSYGKKLGGLGAGNLGGNYRQTRNPITPYLKPSEPESQYSRNLKNKILRDEVSGPSGFLSGNYGYKNKHQDYVERVPSREEINKLVDESLHEALKRHVEETGVKPVPTEVVLVAHDAATIAANRFNKNEKPAEVKPAETFSREDLSHQNEIRQQRVNEKMVEFNNATSLEEVERIGSEINQINQNFFNKMDRLEGSPQKSEPVEPSSSTPLSYEAQKRRNDLDLEAGW